MISFGSLCSGIEAASAAWHPLGWEPAWLSEVAPFPSAVLAHRYPGVPNLGDMTAIDVNEHVANIDVLIGGTPCQAFSVAGLRKSLDDDRGNLSLAFCRLARRIAEFGRLKFVVWENVPGVLSTKDNAFGCFLSGLVGESVPCSPAGEKWTHAGCVYGPEGSAAWRILDAQFFGLAQRRKRVFVVCCPGGWADPSAILFESEGVRRDSPPSRETREGIAASLTRGADSGGRGGYAGRRREDDVNIMAALTSSGRGVSRAGESRGQDPLIVTAFGGNNTAGQIDIATAVNAKGGSGRMDFESETLLVGFDASEDGTGRGTPLIAVHATQDPCINDHIAFALGRNNGQENAIFEEDACGRVPGEVWRQTCNCGHQWTGRLDERCPCCGLFQGGYTHGDPIPFDTTQITSPTYRSNNKPGDQCHTLNAGAHPPAIAFQTSQSGVRCHETHATLDANNGSRRHHGAVTRYGVRRLTPTECERLQGFPDGYTAIEYRGKPAADGPRYQALGNSMAVPVIRWIGRRIVASMTGLTPPAGPPGTPPLARTGDAVAPRGILSQAGNRQ